MNRISIRLNYFHSKIDSSEFFHKDEDLDTQGRRGVFMQDFEVTCRKCNRIFVIRQSEQKLYSVRRRWFDSGVLRGIVRTIRGVLFGGTFMASWYIPALIEGVLLIWYLSRHCKAQILLGICMLVYVTVYYRSSLYSVFSCGNMGASLIAAYEKVFTVLYLSFPVSFLYIWSGKQLAEKGESFCMEKRVLYLLTFALCCLLYIEWRWIGGVSGSIDNDVYVMLPFCCMGLFLIVKDWKLQLHGRNIDLRKASTIIYVTHGSVIAVVGHLIRRFAGESSLLVFMITVMICEAICAIILKLERLKNFRWLRYVY